MEKRRISAQLALKDIRSGLSDGELMRKYRLSPRGLQSLFQKLLAANYIDLEELDQRMPTFMGTVFISNGHAGAEGTSQAHHQDVKGKKSIELQSVLTDIREGLDDSAIMAKYMLTARGLQSVFDHLVFSGLMTAGDLEQRFSRLDSTVDVHELHGKVDKTISNPVPETPAGQEWVCPACGRSQPQEMDECPVCGVIVKKYVEKLAREKGG
ncbi:MAG: hypothetical protein AB1733_13290 [Thermodesulfobacteriota bacterium]